MSDPQVKPCSSRREEVNFHINPAVDCENNLPRKTKLRSVFEIQKVVKSDTCEEVYPPEFVSVNHEFTPEAKRPCLEPSDDRSVHQDCIVKQEPQDDETSENIVMPEFVSIKSEPLDEIHFQSETDLIQEQEDLFSPMPSRSLNKVLSKSLGSSIPSGVPIASASNCVGVTSCSTQVPKQNVSVINENQFVPPHIQALNISLHFVSVNKSYQFPINLKSINTNSTSQNPLDYLKKHVFCTRNKNSSRYSLYCKFCCSKFGNHVSFFKHFSIYHKVAFECLHCKIKFTDLASHILLKHKFSFHENVLELHWVPEIINHSISTLFQCAYCNMSADNYYNFCHHVNTQHHICKICSESFDTGFGLLAHFDQHSSGEVFYLKCNSCDLKLVSFELMTKHVRSCCSSFNKEIVMSPPITVQLHYKCPYCLLSFVKETNLYKHFLSHGNKTCESCKKIFVPSQFVGTESITNSVCITCSLKRNQNFSMELNTFDISIFHILEEFNSSFKELNYENCVDLSFEISAKKSTQNITDLKDFKFNFNALEMESIKETRIKKNFLGMRYPCLFCNNCQVRYNEIYPHFVQCVSLVKFDCKTCNWSTDNIKTFLDHLNENHEFDVKANYYFKSILGEIMYIKTFEKIKNCLRCLFCNVEFEYVLNLLDHVMSTHLNCKYCGITSLKVQEYLGHNTKQNLKKEDNFQCTSCQTVMNCRILATAHAAKCYLSNETSMMTQNNNNEPLRLLPSNIYHCPYCPEHFTREINLILHLTSHNLVHNCSECERQFLPKDFQIYQVSTDKCFMCNLKCKNSTLVPVITVKPIK